jgi:hypothetical protein
MEFVEGITVCSDCGGPLAESEEAAKAMKIKAKEEALAADAAKMAALQEEWAKELGVEVEDLQEAAKAEAEPAGSTVYVKKSQRYDDFQSSASAFYLVGGIVLVGSVLGWANILPIPMTGFSRYLSLGVMTVIGIFCIASAISSTRSAKQVKGQIAEEEDTTKQLINWFKDSYTGEQLDAQIRTESGDLSPEELSLKRFSLIQDILITNHDITDQGYIDMLSEEIYGSLYED